MLPIFIIIISFTVFFLASVSEASISSISKARINVLLGQGKAGANYLDKLQRSSIGASGTGYIVMLLTIILSVVCSTILTINHINQTWQIISIVSITLLVGLISTYSFARLIASYKAETIALKSCFLLHITTICLFPIIALAAAILDRKSRKLPNGTASDTSVFQGDITLPLVSNDEPLDEREVKMIRGVVQLDKTIAREIMVPRVDMIVTETETSLDVVVELMLKSGHSRIPVYQDNLDSVVGIVYARDLLRRIVKDGSSGISLSSDLVRPALFIPESKTLEELLNEFQQRHVHLAIVVDEYGGISGLVTIEDLLEEIVGEIQDEYDIGESEFEAISDSEFIIDARLSIDQVNDLLSISIAGNGFDTLGGYVYHHLGKIPDPGDAVKHGSFTIEVLSVIGRRLKRLRVTKPLT